MFSLIGLPSSEEEMIYSETNLEASDFEGEYSILFLSLCRALILSEAVLHMFSDTRPFCKGSLISPFSFLLEFSTLVFIFLNIFLGISLFGILAALAIRIFFFSTLILILEVIIVDLGKPS